MSLEIMHTVYPEDRPTETEWMEEFKVSTRVAKHLEGTMKAEEIMRQWQSGCSTFIFQNIGDRLLTK